MPPYPRQYNGIAKRALRLLRDKTMALLCSLKEGNSDHLLAEAMLHACDMTKSITSNSGKARNILSPGFSCSAPSTTYADISRHKPAPRGNKCVLLGTTTDRPSFTYRMRDPTTGSVVLHQCVVWHTSNPSAHDGWTAAKQRGGGVGGGTGTNLHAGRSLRRPWRPSLTLLRRRDRVRDGYLRAGG